MRPLPLQPPSNMTSSPEPLPAPDGAHGPTPQQSRILWTALTALAVTILIGVAALVFLGFISFLSWSYPILLPLGLAVIIALVLEPMVDLLQKCRMKRSRATLIVCILAVIAFMLFWSFILPTLWTQGYGFFRDLPDNLNKAAVKLQSNLGDTSVPGVVLATNSTAPGTPSSGTNAPDTSLPSATPADIFHASAHSSSPGHPEALPSLQGTAGAEPAPSSARPLAIPTPLHAWLTGNLPVLQDMIQKNVFSLITSALGPVGQAFGFILGFGFVPIYVYYFLSDQEQITRHWHDYVPLRRSKLRDEVVSVLAEINASLVGYFRGQIIVAGCNGVLTLLGLWILGFFLPLLAKYCLVLGLITGALSIVPFLGIIASIIPALVLAFLSANGDSTWQWLGPLLVLGVFTLVQMSESIFITPRVQSHSTGLHPLTIILGILFWSLLLPGLLGPIVAVPLTCAVVVLLRRYAWPEKATAPVPTTSA